MSDEPEQEENDFQFPGRWALRWQIVFFSFYCIVMVISLGLYMCLIRAVAKDRRKETPVYFFLLFLFFASLIEDFSLIEQFMAIYGHQNHTDSTCQFFTYLHYGNRILQVTIVLAMLYYTWLSVELKTTRFELQVKKFFPVLVAAIFLLQLIVVIWPATSVAGSASGQFCYFVNPSFAVRRRTGWLYQVLFPYFIPLVISIFPLIKLWLKMKREIMVEPTRTYIRITLVVTGSYFFFHLLYYVLMLGREIEMVVLDLPAWRKLIGLHVWFITRPMFTLIGFGWHVTTPLVPFLLDRELRDVFPGKLFRMGGGRADEDDPRNSICLTPTNSSAEASLESTMVNGSGGSVKLTKSGTRTEVRNPFDPDSIEAQEYNQSVC